MEIKHHHFNCLSIKMKLNWCTINYHQYNVWCSSNWITSTQMTEWRLYHTRTIHIYNNLTFHPFFFMAIRHSQQSLMLTHLKGFEPLRGSDDSASPGLSQIWCGRGSTVHSPCCTCRRRICQILIHAFWIRGWIHLGAGWCYLQMMSD